MESIKFGITQCVDKTVEQLEILWSKLGLEKEAQREKLEALVKSCIPSWTELTEQLRTAVDQEKSFYDDFTSKLELFTTKVVALSDELGLQHYEVRSQKIFILFLLFPSKKSNFCTSTNICMF